MPEVSRSQLLAYAVLAVVVVVLGVRFLQSARTPRSVVGGSAQAAPESADGAPDGTGVEGTVRVERSGGATSIVHVAGAVRHPGVYRLPAGARVQDAVRRAGGPRRGGDVNAINLAAKVADGQQVVVPARVRAAVAVAQTTDGAVGGPPAAPISLNSATAQQLDTLDGVGPATARKIIDWRTQHGGFRSVADLGQVPGIGPKRLAALRDKVQP